jgi:hypothetical protein
MAGPPGRRKFRMAVLVTNEAPTAGKEESNRWRALMEEKVRKAPGFIFHADHQVNGGGQQIIEAWESLEHFQRFFETEVKPLLPPGQGDTPPKVVELDNVITR